MSDQDDGGLAVARADLVDRPPDVGGGQRTLVPAAEPKPQPVDGHTMRAADCGEMARNRQQAMVTQYISGPIAEWLTRWPTTGGSDYERLQLILRRMPPALQQTQALIDAAMK